MDCCWEAISIPMTTSFSSCTSITYCVFSMRGNHLLNNEWKLQLPCLLSPRLYICISICGKTAQFCDTRLSSRCLALTSLGVYSALTYLVDHPHWCTRPSSNLPFRKAFLGPTSQVIVDHLTHVFYKIRYVNKCLPIFLGHHATCSLMLGIIVIYKQHLPESPAQGSLWMNGCIHEWNIMYICSKA